MVLFGGVTPETKTVASPQRTTPPPASRTSRGRRSISGVGGVYPRTLTLRTMRVSVALVLVASLAASPAASQRARTPATETAVFAGGCFWGVDAVFKHVRGAVRVVSGYSGGGAATASYRLVNTDT